MSLFFRTKKFVEYQWVAKTQYYLHSPFVYRFYLDVLLNTRFDYLPPLLALRQQLRASNNKVSVTDFGTGTSKERTVSSIEKNVAVKHKYGRLLYSLVQHFKPQHILEIGTSIGLSSGYMALAHAKVQLITLEGSPELVKAATHTHTYLGLTNIETIQGEFSATLPVALFKLKQLDLVYFDGNHTRAATLAYFEQCLTHVHEHSIFVFDDIYWNAEMNEAWKAIKQHPSVTLTIDVYQFGICFFRKENLAKENFVLGY